MPMPKVSGDLLASRKVCVIGAGMAGLAATRELRGEGHAVTVLEQSGDVGGQWLYDPRTDDADPLGAIVPVRVHSSAYASLRLLSPREANGFSGFQFVPRHGVPGRDVRRFPGHGEMQRFLRDFSDAFGLTEAIRFRTKVVRVAMAPPPPPPPPPRQCDDDGDATPKWVVRSVDADETAEVEEVFDAVVVATGHYSQPRLPSIDGMAEWRRRQLHSHSYRVPEPFRDEVVVVVGCGDSGRDIALDILTVAKEVHLTTRSTEASMTAAMCKTLARHANLRLRPQVVRLFADGTVVFGDGSRVVADSVIYCTGYWYSFPFLDTAGVVAVDEHNRVGPLFEHTFPPSLAPWLSFVGVPRMVPVPWYFEAQGRWIAQVLSGRRTLPPELEMARVVEEHYRARELAGVPKECNHDIEPLKVFEIGEKYCDLPRVEEWKRELMESISRNFNDDMETFRDCVDEDSENVRKWLDMWYDSSAKADPDQEQEPAAAGATMASSLSEESELK